MRFDGDEGTATLFILGLALALLAFTALVTDGGLALAMQREAANIAEEAARAGVQVIDEEALRAENGVVRVDPRAGKAAALARAEALISESDFAGQVVSADTLCRDEGCTVRIELERETTLLGIVGKDSIQTSVRRSARLAVGVEEEEG